MFHLFENKIQSGYLSLSFNFIPAYRIFPLDFLLLKLFFNILPNALSLLSKDLLNICPNQSLYSSYIVENAVSTLVSVKQHSC